MTANHLHNRLPIDGLLKTPYEELYSRKPDLHYVKRFGCKAFMHIPDEKRKKLDVKAKELTFVGYEEGTKGYRLVDVSVSKIFISRDVIFMEGDPHIQCTSEIS